MIDGHISKGTGRRGCWSARVAAFVACSLIALGIVACDRHPPERSDTAASAEPGESTAGASALEVHLPAASLAEQRTLIERFRRQSGDDFGGGSGHVDPVVDPLFHLVRLAFRPGHGSVGVGGDPGDVDKVRSFVRANARLLDITDAEVAKLEIRQEDRARLYLVEGAFPRRGYERLRGAARAVRLRIGLNDEGAIIAYNDTSSRLPPFAVRTDPPLKPGDSALLRNVVGRELELSPWGVKRSFGRIEASEVKPPELVLRIAPVAGRELVLTVAYVIHVERGGPLVDFLVDPTDGHVLAQEQAFVN